MIPGPPNPRPEPKPRPVTRFVSADILRCKNCRSLTVGIGQAARCSKGCREYGFDLVSKVAVPEIGLKRALADLEKEGP